LCPKGNYKGPLGLQCQACSNKPSNAHYIDASVEHPATADGTCPFACDTGYSINHATGLCDAQDSIAVNKIVFTAISILGFFFLITTLVLALALAAIILRNKMANGAHAADEHQSLLK